MKFYHAQGGKFLKTTDPSPSVQRRRGLTVSNSWGWPWRRTRPGALTLPQQMERPNNGSSTCGSWGATTSPTTAGELLQLHHQQCSAIWVPPGVALELLQSRPAGTPGSAGKIKGTPLPEISISTPCTLYVEWRTSCVTSTIMLVTCSNCCPQVGGLYRPEPKDWPTTCTLRP